MDADSQSLPKEQKAASALRRTLLLLSISIMVLGGAEGPVVTRMYFLHGGARLWLTSLLENCGFPVVLLPLSISYFRQRGRRGAPIFSVTGRAAAASVGLGLLMGLDSYMHAYGWASLPASTSTLLVAAQLAFTAAFAFLVVKHKFTACSINAVALLLMGSVVLGLQASGDLPDGVSRTRYYLGFFVMIGAAALLGLSTPLIELICLRMKPEKITYALVMEMQMLICLSASFFCVVGMAINKDFQVVPREAKEYGLGEVKYYLVVAACAIFWQLMNLGTVGVISCSSSLLAGIVAALLLPLGEILPVFLLHEKFNGWKAVALALSTWGFVSYLYGEYQQYKTKSQMAHEELEFRAAP